MRGGNFFYRLKGLVRPIIVHRGVSQGGRKLAPVQLVDFWARHRQEVPGVSVHSDRGDNKTVTISLEGLQALRVQSLVIVSNPERPRVWTVGRIMESAEKVPMMSAPSFANGASQRRGGLKL